MYLSEFHETWSVSTDFHKKSVCNFTKIRPVGCTRTDGQEEADARIWRFFERVWRSIWRTCRRTGVRVFFYF